MQVLDTNILIYAADRDSDFHTVCSAYLEDRSRDPTPTYLTWNICYEFLRVVTHARVFHNPWQVVDAMAFLDALFSQRSFSLLSPGERHREVLRQTTTELPDLRGNLLHDLHTAVLMREHGIKMICTRDTDFQRFPFVTIVDPLRR